MNTENAHLVPLRGEGSPEERSCVCCGDLAIAAYEDDVSLCSECRAPLRFLAFPEEYCDFRKGD